MRDRPLILHASGNEPMFAILHEPATPLSPRVGVNLLNPGLRNRMAPNRFNVRLARRLAARGYYVLCLDPPGIGDSGGDLPEDLAWKVQQDVQMGALVAAVRAANRAFASECALDEVVTSGNCGGAITALLEAERDESIARLILLDIPVTLRDIAVDAPRPIYDRRHSAHVLTRYARRMRDWRAWLRLVRLESDYRLIGRALRVGLRPGKPGSRPPQRASTAAASAVSPRPEGAAAGTAAAPETRGSEREGTMSPRFLGAMRKVHGRGARVLFINSERSKTTFVFDTRFAEVHLAPGGDMHGPHEVVTVPGANHTYSTREWFDGAADAILAWLEATRAVNPARG